MLYGQGHFCKDKVEKFLTEMSVCKDKVSCPYKRSLKLHLQKPHGGSERVNEPIAPVRPIELYEGLNESEEKIIELYPTDKIKSPVHLSNGQEAIAVGVNMAHTGSLLLP